MSRAQRFWPRPVRGGLMFGQFRCLCNWDVETGLLVSEEDMCDEHKGKRSVLAGCTWLGFGLTMSGWLSLN